MRKLVINPDGVVENIIEADDDFQMSPQALMDDPGGVKKRDILTEEQEFEVPDPVSRKRSTPRTPE